MTTNTLAIPEDVTAEEAILAAVILDNSLLAEAAVLPVEAFASPKRRQIFAAMLQLAKAEQPIDIVTLLGAMKGQEIEMVGSELTALIDGTSILENITGYVDNVHRKHVIRQALRQCSLAMRQLSADDADVSTVQAVVSKLAKITDAAMSSTDTVIEVMDIAPAWALDLEAKRNGEAKDVITTGYRKLDKALGGGFYRGELVIIGGRPGYGKTALMLTFALQMALRGIRVHFVSLEMSHSSLIDRAVAQTIRVDSRLLRSGEVSDAEAKLAYEAAMNIAVLPLTINDERKRSPESVLSEIRKLHRQKDGLDVVIVDYMGLMRYKSRDLRIEIGEALKDVRDLGAEQGTVMMVGSQLNRQADGLKEGKRPKLSDFKESGDLEQDADVALFPYRPSYEPGAIQVATEKDAEIIIAKQRNGPTGVISMEYHPRFTLYRELAA